MSKAEIFVNDKFRVLSYMFDIMDKNNLARITQSELVEELDLSRSTVNNIFKALKDNGYLLHEDKQLGKYYLTEFRKALVIFYVKFYKSIFLRLL